MKEAAKYKKAAEVLEESKKWPENLGIGKPYSLDTRLEDYLLATCFGELKLENKKQELLETIIEKTKESKEVSSVNHLFGLLSLKDLNKEEEANKLLLELENSTQEKGLKNKTTLAIAFYNNDKEELAELKDQEIINEGIWNIIVIMLNK